MKVTHRDVARMLNDYLNSRITLAELVDWAETAMMEAEFDPENQEVLRDIIARIGLADVKAFGMTWEDCESFLRQLGYRVSVKVSEISAKALV